MSQRPPARPQLDTGRGTPVGVAAPAFLGLGDLALLQHWGTAGVWLSDDEIPDLVRRLFLEGAAERGVEATSTSRDGPHSRAPTKTRSPR